MFDRDKKCSVKFLYNQFDATDVSINDLDSVKNNINDIIYHLKLKQIVEKYSGKTNLNIHDVCFILNEWIAGGMNDDELFYILANQSVSQSIRPIFCAGRHPQVIKLIYEFFKLKNYNISSFVSGIKEKQNRSEHEILSTIFERVIKNHNLFKCDLTN